MRSLMLAAVAATTVLSGSSLIASRADANPYYWGGYHHRFHPHRFHRDVFFYGHHRPFFHHRYYRYGDRW
jgi:hypothetical protein